MRRRPIVPLLLMGLLAGCGSTVATSQLGSTAGDGLTAAAGPTAATGTTSTTGQLSGGTTGVPGTVAGPDGSNSSPTLPGNPTTRAQGPSVSVPGAAKGVVKVGIVLTAVSNADTFGVSLGNTVSERDVDQALVDALNAKGGLAGRRIVPIFAQTDTGSASWETDFSAACATFTQDNKVNAVLGYVFNYFASFERCLQKNGVVHLTTSFNIPDYAELRQYPLFLALDVPTIERRTLAKIDGAVATGYLTAKSKIGLLSDDCPGTQRSLQATALPALARAGLMVAKSVRISCVNGASDNGSAVSAIQNAELAFASAGVDRVMFHSVSEGPALLQFAITAETQKYRPGYVMSSLANLQTLSEQGVTPKEQAKNIHAFGWFPAQDIPPRTYPRRNASQDRCLSLLKSKGVVLQSSADYSYGFNICEAFFAYEAALLRTHGDPAGPAVMQALRGLGRSLPSVTNLNGLSMYGPGRFDTLAVARPLLYQESCSCFAYVGAAREIPTP